MNEERLNLRKIVEMSGPKGLGIGGLSYDDLWKIIDSSLIPDFYTWCVLDINGSSQIGLVYFVGNGLYALVFDVDQKKSPEIHFFPIEKMSHCYIGTVKKIATLTVQFDDTKVVFSVPEERIDILGPMWKLIVDRLNLRS